jgi:hypothetical protein
MLAVVVEIVDNTPSIVEWAPVIAAGLASVAATASWGSVLLTRRSQRDADRPQLAINFYRLADDLHLYVHVENIGRGTAKKPTFYIVAEGESAGGVVPQRGILGPGQGLTIQTNLTPHDPDSAQLVTFCLDRDNVVHASSRGDEYKEFGKPHGRTIEWYFDQFYEAVDHDALREQAWRIVDTTP